MIERKLLVRIPKKFLGVRFGCCGKYRRIYVNKNNTAYEGRCPGCFRFIRIRIAKGGMNCRFFEVS
jgi:hypothetical protein